MDNLILAPWAVNVLTICVALMLTALAIFLSMTAIKTAIDAEARLQSKRRKKETKALNNWQKLYEEEHSLRINETANLIVELTNVQCENKRMKEIMAKVKVKDL
jgi:hypothetical protein